MPKKKSLSSEDIKRWKDYIKNPTDLFDKDLNNQINSKKKNRYRFDLHGFSLNDANIKVKEIIFSCIKNKYKEILLITGKGLHSTNDQNVYSAKDLGKLKYSVPEFINSDPELSVLVLSVKNAEAKDGGEGALIIKLKKPTK